jgi:hypothetical protein
MIGSSNLQEQRDSGSPARFESPVECVVKLDLMARSWLAPWIAGARLLGGGRWPLCCNLPCERRNLECEVLLTMALFIIYRAKNAEKSG